MPLTEIGEKQKTMCNQQLFSLSDSTCLVDYGFLAMTHRFKETLSVYEWATL